MAMGNRKAATEYAVGLIEKIIPGSPNTERVRNELESLSDAQFDDLMKAFRDGEDWLSIIVPNGASYDVSTERNLKLGDEVGHKFFERIWFEDQSTGMRVLSNQPALIFHQQGRRQKQHLLKKSSIASDNRHVDELTGQPTGDSKGSAISNPQLLILRSRRLDAAAEEFMSVRAGDAKAFNYSNRTIFETGDVTLDEIRRLGTRPKSVETLSIFFTTQHLENNL